MVVITKVIPRPDSFSPKLAGLVGMLLETRKDTLALINNLSLGCIDFTLNDRKIETIGTTLFHIAAIEFSWILEDIGKKEWDNEKWKYAFSLRESVNIDQIKGNKVSFYIDTLSEVRKESLDLLLTLKDSDLEKILLIDGHNFSIEWILYHVHSHEMYHAGQINFLKRLFTLQH